MTAEARKELADGVWDNTPSLFLPTDILDMAFDVLYYPLNLAEDSIKAISFLAWYVQLFNFSYLFCQQRRLFSYFCRVSLSFLDQQNNFQGVVL